MKLNDVTMSRQSEHGFEVRFPDGRIWIFHDQYAWFEYKRMFVNKISHLDLRRTKIRLAA